MGIHISHSEPVSRSALTIANLGQHLADALPARDWRKIRHLFDGRFADVAHIPHGQAGEIGAILHRAADSPRMPDDWGSLARLIGDAAQTAAGARQTWVWS
ncbi:hypothetical protein [Streptomyces scopuliridis]|uniref:DUF7739 domain-containing protein n=1 Tax=Streptomyces scopuliridis TaxID=452529 RepID=UPI003685415F